MAQRTMAVDALARSGIGFGLSSSLGQQTERFLGTPGQFFFDMAQILFCALVNELQPSFHILAPRLELDIGQLRGGDLGCGSSRCRFECPLGEDLLSQTLGVLLRVLASLGSASLTSGFDGGAHGWGVEGSRRRHAGVGETPGARRKDKRL